MFCGSCGASVAPDGKFCGRCGTPVGATPAPSAVEPDVSEMTIMRPSHAMTQPPAEAPTAYTPPVEAPTAPIAPTAPVAPAAPQAYATPTAPPAYAAPSAPAAYSAPRATSPVTFNAGNWGTLDFVGLGAGLLFFIFSLLNGFIHISASGGSMGDYSYSGTSGTAWHSWGWLGTLIVLAAVALLVAKAFDGLIPKTVPLPLITAVAAGAGWLLLMIRSWTYDAGYSGISVSPGWSAWVMTVLGLVLIGVTVFPLINGQSGAPSHGYGAATPPAYRQPQAYPQQDQQPQAPTDYPQPPGQYPPPPA